MLYGFRHFPTPDGRRVELSIDRAEYERALTRVPAGFFDGADRLDTGDSVRLTLTIGAAFKLCDALASVGGDSAVTARLFGDQLDGMMVELVPRAPSLAPWVPRQYKSAVGF